MDHANTTMMLSFIKEANNYEVFQPQDVFDRAGVYVPTSVSHTHYVMSCE